MINLFSIRHYSNQPYCVTHQLSDTNISEPPKIPVFFSVDSREDQASRSAFQSGLLTASGVLHPDIATLNINHIQDDSLTDYVWEQLNTPILLSNGKSFKMGGALVYLRENSSLLNADSEFRFLGSHLFSNLKESFIERLFKMAVLTNPHVIELLTPEFYANLKRGSQKVDMRLLITAPYWQGVLNVAETYWNYIAQFYPEFEGLGFDEKALIVKDLRLNKYWVHTLRKEEGIFQGHILSGIDRRLLAIGNQFAPHVYEGDNFELVFQLGSLQLDDQGNVRRDKLSVHAESKGVCLLSAPCHRGLNHLSLNPESALDTSILFDCFSRVMLGAFTRQTTLISLAANRFLAETFTGRAFVKVSTKEIKRATHRRFEDDQKANSILTLMLERYLSNYLSHSLECKILFKTIWLNRHPPEVQKNLNGETRRLLKSFVNNSTELDVLTMMRCWYDVPVLFLEIPYGLSGLIALGLRPPLDQGKISPNVQLISMGQKPAINICLSRSPTYKYTISLDLLGWIQTLQDQKYALLPVETWDILLEQALDVVPKTCVFGSQSVIERQSEIFEGLTALQVEINAKNLFENRHPYFLFAGTALLFVGYLAGHTSLLKPLLMEGIERLLMHGNQKLYQFALTLLEKLADRPISSEEFPSSRDSIKLTTKLLNFLTNLKNEEADKIVQDTVIARPEITEVAQYFNSFIEIATFAGNTEPARIFAVLTEFMENFEPQTDHKKRLLVEAAKIWNKNTKLILDIDIGKRFMRHYSLERSSLFFIPYIESYLDTYAQLVSQEEEIEPKKTSVSYPEKLIAIMHLIQERKLQAAIDKLIHLRSSQLNEKETLEWCQCVDQSIICKDNLKILIPESLLYHLFLKIPETNEGKTLKTELVLFILQKAYIPAKKTYRFPITPFLPQLLSTFFNGKNHTLQPAQQVLILSAVKFFIEENTQEATQFKSSHARAILELAMTVKKEKNLVNCVLDVLAEEPLFYKNQKHQRTLFVLLTRYDLGLSFAKWFTCLILKKIENREDYRLYKILWSKCRGLLRCYRHLPQVTEQLFLLAQLLFDTPNTILNGKSPIEDDDCVALVKQYPSKVSAKGNGVFELIKNMELCGYTVQRRFELLLTAIKQQIKSDLFDPIKNAREVITIIESSKKINYTEENTYVLFSLLEILFAYDQTREKVEIGIKLATYINRSVLDTKHRALLTRQLQLCKEYLISEDKDLLPTLAQLQSFGRESRELQITIFLDLIQAALDENQVLVATELLFKALKKNQSRINSKLALALQNTIKKWLEKEWPSEHYLTCIQLLTRRDLSVHLLKKEIREYLETLALFVNRLTPKLEDHEAVKISQAYQRTLPMKQLPSQKAAPSADEFFENIGDKSVKETWVTPLKQVASVARQPTQMEAILKEWESFFSKEIDLKREFLMHPVPAFWGIYNAYYHCVSSQQEKYNQDISLLKIVLMSAKIDLKDRIDLLGMVFKIALKSRSIPLLEMVASFIVPLKLRAKTSSKWCCQILTLGIEQKNTILISLACQSAIKCQSEKAVAARFVQLKLNTLPLNSDVSITPILHLVLALLSETPSEPFELTLLADWASWVMQVQKAKAEEIAEFLCRLLTQVKKSREVEFKSLCEKTAHPNRKTLLHQVKEAIGQMSQTPKGAKLAINHMPTLSSWLDQSESFHLKCMETHAKHLHETKGVSIEERKDVFATIQALTPELKEKTILQANYAKILAQVYSDMVFANNDANLAVSVFNGFVKPGMKPSSIKEAQVCSHIALTPLCMYLRYEIIEGLYERIPSNAAQSAQSIFLIFQQLSLFLTSYVTDEQWLQTEFSLYAANYREQIEKFIFADLIELDDQNLEDEINRGIIKLQNELLVECKHAQLFKQFQLELWVYKLKMTGGKCSNEIADEKLYQKAISQLEHLIKTKYPHFIDYLDSFQQRGEDARRAPKTKSSRAKR